MYNTAAYARRIPRQLRVTSIFPNNGVTSYRGNDMTVDVNWGCGPKVIRQFLKPNRQMLNADISGAYRKMRTFELLDAANLPHPRIVTDPKQDVDGTPFYMRGKYLGRTDGLMGGQGITIYEKGQLPEAKHDFYSQVVSKKQEVRIHIAKNPDGTPAILCTQFKYIPEGADILIRNHANGAKFSSRPLHERMDGPLADQGIGLAFSCLLACNLDFGAVDMALSQKNQWYIFEINSAPGLTEREDDPEAEIDNPNPCSYDGYLNYFKQYVIERPLNKKKRGEKRKKVVRK
jgi:hypothetical protein